MPFLMAKWSFASAWRIDYTWSTFWMLCFGYGWPGSDIRRTTKRKEAPVCCNLRVLWYSQNQGSWTMEPIVLSGKTFSFLGCWQGSLGWVRQLCTLVIQWNRWLGRWTLCGQRCEQDNINDKYRGRARFSYFGCQLQMAMLYRAVIAEWLRDQLW